MVSNMDYAKNWMQEVVDYLEKENLTFRKLVYLFSTEDANQFSFISKHGAYCHGAFRVAFISNERQIVIKTGYCKDGEFQCKLETEHWQAARKERVAKYFAPFLGSFEIGDITFYVFKRIDNIGEAGSESYPPLRSWRDVPNYSDDYVYLFYKNSEIMNKLANFLNRHNIWDLHGGNFGFKDGYPVLVDYAGV